MQPSPKPNSKGPAAAGVTLPAVVIALPAVVMVLLVASAFVFGLFLSPRSLWLDEAWVANSVNAPTLREMFYYPGWLQTSPPLFLLLLRVPVHVLALPNALVMIPLALEILAVAFFFAAARSVVSLPLAAVAATAVAFHPVAVEYSSAAKQYSGEMAASAALLAVALAHFESPSRKSFAALLAAALAALPLSYPAAFLIPGLVLALWISGQRRRAAWLAAGAGGMLALLYWWFIAPNYSPALRQFWAADTARGWSPGLFAGVLICAAAVARALWIARRSADWRVWAQLICALPVLLLAASAALQWYPASPRTRLFVLPCFVLLLASLAEELLGRWRLVKVAAWIAAIAIPLLAGSRQIREQRYLPEEDLARAVVYLQQHVAPADLVLVHPSLKEGFDWYSAKNPPRAARILYGDTGWPCCARGHLSPPHSSSRAAVLADLDAKIPSDFKGRVWLMYSTRPTQWEYVGLDEGNLWRSQVWAMGCPPEGYVALINVGISPMNCSGRK